MERRTFFHYGSWLLSGLAVAFVTIPGVRFLVDPLSERFGKRRRYRLLKLDDLEVDVPRKMVISDRRVDAWTRYPKAPVGAIWLHRRDENSVEAYSATCPHLGCPVAFLATDKQFICPCHEARYAVDGGIIAGPQQRGLDELEVSTEMVDGDKWVSVLFERFELGGPEKISFG